MRTVQATIIRRGAGALFAATLAGGALVATAASSGAQADSESYAYTGEDETFVVPAGVCQLEIDAVGANGADAITNEVDSPALGGDGGVISALVPVTAGEELLVQVGGPGTSNGGINPGFGGSSGASLSGGDGGTSPGDGFAGAGGGGASAVSRASGATLIAAGGGGGGGGQSFSGVQVSADGGDGGGEAGGDGAPDGPGGGGATSDAPGAGGGDASFSGEPGFPGVGPVGGEGGGGGRAGGGAGGGWFGGGGGAGQQVDQQTIQPGGGGGGSSNAIAGATILANDPGANTNVDGEGSIVISWEPGVGCVAPIEAVIRFTG